MAKGDSAGSRRRLPLHRPRLRRLRPLRQAARYRLVLLDRHAELTATLLEDLDLRDATAVVHDWGGPIGLRLAVESDRISRMVIMDTGLFTGDQPMSEAWHRFRDFVERTEDLPVGMLVRGACANDPGDE